MAYYKVDGKFVAITDAYIGITVYESNIGSIHIVKNPDQTTYDYGGQEGGLDYEGLKLDVNFTNGKVWHLESYGSI